MQILISEKQREIDLTRIRIYWNQKS